MLKALYALLAILLLPSSFVQAQTILYSENFESGGASISLNTSDMGGTATGDNPWIINNVYAGGSGNFFCPAFGISLPYTVPAAPQQPVGITNNPTSQHLHITPQIAITSGGTLPAASYLAADGFCFLGGQSNFAKMNTDANTMGYDSVVFDHWWACGGGTDYYGELYYSTDGGSTWLIVQNPLSGTNNWVGQTTWMNTKLSLPVWSNQTTLRFGFRFITGTSSTGADPGYELDDISITGYTSCAATTNSFATAACESYTSPSGQLWTSSNTYVDTISNSAGCDSIITINLTINNNSNSFSETSCGVYTSPSGQVWTSSNTYMDTIQNTAGCDSVITVNLTVVHIDTNIVGLVNNGLMSTDTNSTATFQWIDCATNLPIVGETSSTYNSVPPGNYAVIVTVNGCSDTSSCMQVFTSVSLVDNNLNWQLFPNPTTSNFTIDLGTTIENATIRIFNNLGQLVDQQNTISTQKINLSINKPNGIYFVQIQTDSNKTATFKVLKQ